MSKEVRNIVEKVLYWILNIGISCILYFSFTYFYIYTSSYDDYFHYTSIESEKDVYKVGDDLVFISNIVREKPLYMEYNDILRCDFGEDYTWFSSTKTYSKKIDQVGEISSSWRYEGDLPKLPATCFLDSYPTVILDYGIQKTQNIRSNTFILEDTK